MPATSFDTPIGRCAIAWNADEITGFFLLPSRRSQDEPPPWVEAIVARAKRHLAGELQDFANVPYAWSRVSPFQRAVYQAALRVKPGQTSTYGELATAIGRPSATARDVGTALGQNPWALLVPCHRFIGSDGRMTGFSSPGGIKTKLRLLALEGVELFAE
jgi:methylated-DNA-[protein]-cysteine S-methyltransferase